MTVVVGANCQNGVVLGADGAATFTTSAGQWVAKQPAKKIYICDEIAVATSGPVGVGQQICARVEQLFKAGSFKKGPTEAMSLLRKELWEDVLKEEVEIAAKYATLLDPQAAYGAIMGEALIAMPLKGAARLFSFDYRHPTNLLTQDLPFCSIGSGQTLADPFIAFQRRLFWPDGRPMKLAGGKFAVLWTLRHVIRTAPAGIGEPIQVVTLSQEGGQWKARELSEAELQETQQSVAEVEEVPIDWRNKVRGESPATAPDIPKRPV